ncbi:MAG TPA: NADH-quinone oxidoreductase subunit NuoF [Chloroflexota bacterium]|nr:NADH-quinone oxidoreductase subunit NuoF [Chloroflexota bacterium]
MVTMEAAPTPMPLLTAHLGTPGAWTYDFYVRHGGYEQWKRALQGALSRETITDEVKKSGIRGRGGAGFPVASKWSTLPPLERAPRYIVVNGDESEPGTCHDRFLVEEDPHQMLEGALLCAFAVNAHRIFIYLRGEFGLGAERMTAAIDAAYAHGLLGENIMGSGFSLDAVVYRGAGAYICGEETALIQSLNGYRGITRLKPPYFPASLGGGAWGMPTIMQNVQTMANLPLIVKMGGEEFAKIGDATPMGAGIAAGPVGTGTMIYSVSGHVNRPGNYELPLGVTVRELIAAAGGVLGGKAVKAVIPGGGTSAWLDGSQLDTKMDFKNVPAVGFGYILGTGATTVMNEDICVPHCLAKISYFYHHESCGECTPCREGGAWMYKTLLRILDGRGRPEDMDLLQDLCDNIEGKTLCQFGYSVTWPVRFAIKKWREEFEYHIREGKCPAGDHPFGVTTLTPAV